MVVKSVHITNETGLHARPASMFVQMASKFQSQITIKHGENSYNAKSIMALLSAGICCGNEVEICAEGNDEEQAASTLVDLIASKFGE
ncbi:MAG: HPr family phosphocarrier protein [Maledivibacter sp.]|jgi:phosphocarrier protein|nr:HPr family phosphocarrier protein [Maledivibacter sp.]